MPWCRLLWVTLGLVESVNDLVEAVGLLQNLNIEFRHCHFNEDNLPENVKLTLYRIIQEALNNIIKHAQASIIHIQLSRSKGFVLVKNPGQRPGLCTG